MEFKLEYNRNKQYTERKYHIIQYWENQIHTQRD